jgi:hypothetical protein
MSRDPILRRSKGKTPLPLHYRLRAQKQKEAGKTLARKNGKPMEACFIDYNLPFN